MNAKGSSFILAKYNTLTLKRLMLSLFVALVLCFTLGNTTSGHNRALAKASVIREELQFLAEIEIGSHQFTRLDIPYESSAIPGDREIPNENEPDEDPDSDSDSIVEHIQQLTIADVTTPVSWGAYSSGLFQNLSRVPLFVLHHSWKSYIA